MGGRNNSKDSRQRFSISLSSSVNSGDVFVQRRLTTADLKDYAERTYHGSGTAQLMTIASPGRGFHGNYASFNLKNRSEVIHVNLDKFPHIQEILASKIRSAGATSEGREPLRLVVPPSVPIELWDSGLAISAHAGDTLQTIATTYHVPLWTLTQLNKASETAALTEGQRVVIPHSVGQKIPSSLAQNPVSSDATPAGN
jgi:hypothetical protein